MFVWITLNSVKVSNTKIIICLAIMFIPSALYRRKIEDLINDSQSVRVAVAFWGEHSDELFNDQGKQIRIICNLLSGGTNPVPIQNLLRRPNLEIRRLETLHAKVILGDQSAIIGSANLSTNGLNHEVMKTQDGLKQECKRK